MKKGIIAIDVDLTLVATDVMWWEWLEFNFTQIRELPEKGRHYDLGYYFNVEEGIDHFEFWGYADLYDNVPTQRGAIAAIRDLWKAGYTIVFVSKCIPSHQESKENMLKDLFDFLPKDEYHFISTEHKGFVKCDYLIDDRNKHLNQMDTEVKKIRYRTPYVQEVRPLRIDFESRDWFAIRDYILNGYDKGEE